jgi:hypothetical protein
MPLFQSQSKQEGPLALAKDKLGVVAYALTPVAVRRLRESGVRSGRKFPASVLAALIRSGDAHSPRPADAPGQALLFADDETVNQLPRCELTGSTADLHLVVHQEGTATVAKLLSEEPRSLVQRTTTLSIPVWALSSDLLDQLEVTGKVPQGSAAARTLRQWFQRDYAGAWEKLRAANVRQPGLDLGPDDGELPLARLE